jgi:serine/threonine protein kinase
MDQRQPHNSNIPHETFQPELVWAATKPTNAVVLRSDPHETPPPVYLLRQERSREAYALIPDKEPIQNHRHWGDIVFAVVYECVGDPGSRVFQAPSEDSARFVAIKRLRLAAVHEYLQKGGSENPYRDICRMREMGDNIHVLQCIDALRDDEFLYIVTPKACELGTLQDAAFGGSEPMDRNRAKMLFRKILQILSYLDSFDISHRDFTPDNFIFLTPDNLVVFDLAMSHRIPRNEQGERILATPQDTVFGSFGYIAPEIAMSRMFDGLAADLWSASVILYNLLTSRPLYRFPHPSDIFFRYNILAQAAFSPALNERAIEVLEGVSEDDEFFRMLMKNVMANLNYIGPASAELLKHSFEIDPQFRWTLRQVMQSQYVQQMDAI